MAGRYSSSILLVWQIAAVEAKKGHASEIEPAHLLIALCKFCDLDFREFLAGEIGLTNDRGTLIDAFQATGIDPTRFRRRLREVVSRPNREPTDVDMVHRSPLTHQVFRWAEQMGGSSFQPRHLLVALFQIVNPPWTPVLNEMGYTEAVNLWLEKMVKSNATPEDDLPDWLRDGPDPIPKKGDAVATPNLNRYGRDLTQLAREGLLDPIIGRHDEIRSLARIMAQKRKSNAMLVGEAGVGKTGLVEGLAQRMVEADAHSALKDKRIVELSMNALVAGTKYRGEFEERIEKVFREASTDDKIILFIDEIHTVLTAGMSEGGLSAANVLKPALARGDFACIGATTITEYRRHIERDPALERRFQIVWVAEPTSEETLEILDGLRPRFEEHHGLQIADEALDAAVTMSVRYLPDYRLPDKAIDLVDQACAAARIATLTAGKAVTMTGRIGRDEIAAAIASRCRLPLERITQGQAQRLLEMETSLRRRVLGQEQAVAAVAHTVRTARAGMKDPRRPVGVFLFVGMTGTGKTELAKALAEFLFDDERRLIRIDMSEYMEQHTVARLIGAPPGYVGHEQEGQLTGAVRSNPYSVVLFDEVEKAHAEVLNLFLQIFDEGHLTDTHGRQVSFAETVIILTSNLGSQVEAPRRALGFGGRKNVADELDAEIKSYESQIMSAVSAAFRPELLNRVQQVVFFYPLAEETVRLIVDKLLDNLRARLSQHQIDFKLRDSAYALLMQEGFDRRYGAREMERTIERRLAQPISKIVLEGNLAEGVVLNVDAVNGKLVFQDESQTRSWSGLVDASQ